MFGPNEVIVAFGTTTGKSREHARIIASSFETTAVEMNTITPISLLKYRLAIFVISTYGPGLPAEDSMEFIKSLTISERLDLSNLNVAILGFGSRHYKRFCGGARALESALLGKRANFVIPLAECDTRVDNIDDVRDQFVYRISGAIQPSRPLINVTIIESNISNLPPTGFTIAPIVAKNTLSHKGYVPRMTRYSIQISSPYFAGYHAEILPRNLNVKPVLDSLHLLPDTQLQIESDLHYFPPHLSIESLFEQYIDLNCRPSRTSLEFFNHQGEVPRTVRQLILSHPQAINDIEALVNSLPLIEPRIYSVASSKADSLDLIVTTHSEGVPGLATTFLESATEVPIKIHPGSLTYPKDKTTPFIFVALGTGIAPVVAFLQERAKLAEKGPALLFYGTRSEEASESLNDELRQYVDQRVLDGFFMATSREGDHKHVNDLMEEKANEIWEVWKDERCIMFICGPVGDFQETVHQSIINACIKCGGMDEQEAEFMIRQHEWYAEQF